MGQYQSFAPRRCHSFKFLSTMEKERVLTGDTSSLTQGRREMKQGFTLPGPHAAAYQVCRLPLDYHHGRYTIREPEICSQTLPPKWRCTFFSTHGVLFIMDVPIDVPPKGCYGHVSRTGEECNTGLTISSFVVGVAIRRGQ